MEEKQKRKVEAILFYPPLILLAAFCLWAVNDAEKAGAVLQKVYYFVTNTLGWVFQWYYVLAFLLFLYFVCGPYAHKKLGEGPPEFSTLTWWGMMFTAGTSLGVMFWATMETFWDLQFPAMGAQPFSPEAARWALSYPLFHWGPLCWGIYAVFAVAFAFMFFVQKQNVVRPSSACESLLGTRLAKGWLGRVIDIIFLIGLIGGISTSTGILAPVIGELFSKVFGFEHNIRLDSIIIFSWIFVVAATVYTGVNKGIKILSDIRVYLGFAVLLLLLFFGPTSFILNSFTDSVGHLAQNFVMMSFNLDPHAKGGFPQNWTIFYWAWIICLCLPAGLYYGRISKGRTVRELVTGVLIGCMGGSWIFFAVFANYLLDIVNKGVFTPEQLTALGQISSHEAVVKIWSTMPFAGITLVVFFILAYISNWTLVNGAVYTISMVSTKELTGEEEPPKWSRVFWSVALCCLTLALVNIGQLKAVQTMTVAASVPMLFVTTTIILTMMKDLRREWGSEQIGRNPQLERQSALTVDQEKVQA
ncbi:hypothetical protein DCMF_24215 [Candidatus Formimonas warabiya]|uniref:BCCT family transporter n=2 Tax=Formimonas warabiya TaxID=1761012 RepID=A0A3G1L2M0_FORW1|nr:hypothetical protein DCMF_24215 [Candidatus Formimonas warabiya]